ncbi:MAG TPA: hypothetical protein VJ652_05695, partial [Noviherbaspirillum sp.]|nr:hypothetical protein [Noviherbaspirillum sp.]
MRLEKCERFFGQEVSRLLALAFTPPGSGIIHVVLTNIFERRSILFFVQFLRKLCLWPSRTACVGSMKRTAACASLSSQALVTHTETLGGSRADGFINAIKNHVHGKHGKHGKQQYLLCFPCLPWTSLLQGPVMGKRILLIQGHPDAGKLHLCHALEDAYAGGARSAG